MNHASPRSNLDAVEPSDNAGPTGSNVVELLLNFFDISAKVQLFISSFVQLFLKFNKSSTPRVQQKTKIISVTSVELFC